MTRRQHTSMSTKKNSERIIRTPHGTLRVEWADKNKTRTRRIDQRLVDRYLIDGKINNSQHQAANWYLGLASTAQATPHLTSQVGKMRVGTSKPIITNRQAEARLILNKVEDFVRRRVSKTGVLVMRNVVLYDESMREQQRKYGGKLRSEGMSVLGHALDALDQIMGKYASRF